MKNFIKERLEFTNELMVEGWWNEMNFVGKILLFPVWAFYYVFMFLFTLLFCK